MTKHSYIRPKRRRKLNHLEFNTETNPWRLNTQVSAVFTQIFNLTDWTFHLRSQALSLTFSSSLCSPKCLPSSVIMAAVSFLPFINDQGIAKYSSCFLAWVLRPLKGSPLHGVKKPDANAALKHAYRVCVSSYEHSKQKPRLERPLKSHCRDFPFKWL